MTDPGAERVLDQLRESMEALRLQGGDLRKIRVSTEALAGEVAVAPDGFGNQDWLIHPGDWERLLAGLGAEMGREGYLFGVPVINETGE
jgi:hypothetical protein